MISQGGSAGRSLVSDAVTRVEERPAALEAALDTMMMAERPPETPRETQAMGCYRQLIPTLHLMLQGMRRGEAVDQSGEYAYMIPVMLREAADRLDGVRS
jgi:hypothetical protein